jgi:ATPase family protein associated with various cellular activities (AAA)/winged helix domain-containing protein
VTDWLERNQGALTSELGRIARCLELHADGGAPPAAEGRAEPPALEALAAAFGLSPFERDVLLLCAGVELEGRFAGLCATAAGDAHLRRPTFGLALACLPEAHWSALAPAAPLRRWRLVDVEAGDTVPTSPLRVDERVLHHLTGLDYVDERLAGVAERIEPPPSLPASQAAAASRVAAALRGAGLVHSAVVVCGIDPDARREVVARGAADAGQALHVSAAADLPAHAGERDVLARLWEREAILSRAILMVELEDGSETELVRRAAAFADALSAAAVVVASREPVKLGRRVAVRIEVARPSAGEQRRLWKNALGEQAGSLNGALDALVTHFDLGPRAIVGAVAQAAGDTPPLEDALWEACRAQARPRLDDLARRIEPAAGWDDIVLPALQLEALHEIAAHVRGQRRVYDDWGFARKSSRGLGISALFEGVSGTGKTMAAEVLALELRLDLYRIDLSQVVSKYIGETEKNLQRVFDAAESGGTILLFDEADALFGKRTEVKDSHDRYANIEVSYLLQRMEAYRGLAILTTNLKSALDGAFLRRIRFVVPFPFPDPAQRAEIWRRIFPAETPVEGVDPERLARLNVAGGNIRNIALGAAFAAADEGEPVRMEHLLRAARIEYAKLEKPLSEAEIGGWT